MNEAEVKSFKKKLIKCNITIHIQQLGTACSPNDDLLMEELHNLGKISIYSIFWKDRIEFKIKKK
jgi:hypothetical protein